MYGISIDLGTSGTRMHAIDLKSGQIISTAITVRHPTPGANVMESITPICCLAVITWLNSVLVVDLKVVKVIAQGSPTQIAEGSTPIAPYLREVMQ